MAWTALKTWSPEDVLPAADLNTYVRDNFLATEAAAATAASRLIVTSGANAVVARDPAQATVAAAETTTASASFGDLATVGPAVTATTGATAIVVLSFTASNNTAGKVCAMSYTVSGASTIAAGDSAALIVESNGANQQWIVSLIDYCTGLTPGSNVFTARYRVQVGAVAGAAGTGTFSNRRVMVIPL